MPDVIQSASTKIDYTDTSTPDLEAAVRWIESLVESENVDGLIELANMTVAKIKQAIAERQGRC